MPSCWCAGGTSFAGAGAISRRGRDERRSSNTFVFDDPGENIVNLNRWIWIRGGTGIITDDTMLDMKTRMWADCTEIV